MANYYGAFRTNYFQVSNEEKLKDIVSRMSAGEDSVDLFTNHAPYYGFGGYGLLCGVFQKCENGKEDESAYDIEADFDLMVKELQAILPNNEAIIIMNVGHEKLRYVTGHTVIITHSDCSYIDMACAAKAKAKEMVGDTDWDTVCEY